MEATSLRNNRGAVAAQHSPTVGYPKYGGNLRAHRLNRSKEGYFLGIRISRKP